MSLLPNERVRIVSDGTAQGTTVYFGNRVCNWVTAVAWKVELGKPATATITFMNVAVDVTGERTKA